MHLAVHFDMTVSQGYMAQLQSALNASEAKSFVSILQTYRTEQRFIDFWERLLTLFGDQRSNLLSGLTYEATFWL